MNSTFNTYEHSTKITRALFVFADPNIVLKMFTLAVKDEMIKIIFFIFIVLLLYA